MPTIIKLKDITNRIRSDCHKNNPKPIHLNSRDKYWAKYYQCKGWDMLRNQVRIEEPLCQICLQEGRVTPTTEIHHIAPFGRGFTQKERFEMLLDRNNVIGLCSECHDKVHRGEYPEYLKTRDQYYNEKANKELENLKHNIDSDKMS